jgi:predicted DNA-binding protein (MmcQ/YjbR family)
MARWKEQRDLAQAACEQRPGAELTFPFGDGVEVYKVAGKMFALIALGDSPHLNVKVDPQDGIELREMHPTLEPGYHMNKRHWITVRLGDEQITSELIADLIEDSHALVVATLPKRDQPRYR